MRVGLVTEVKPGERRCALTPAIDTLPFIGSSRPIRYLSIVDFPLRREAGNHDASPVR